MVSQLIGERERVHQNDLFHHSDWEELGDAVAVVVFELLHYFSFVQVLSSLPFDSFYLKLTLTLTLMSLYLRFEMKLAIERAALTSSEPFAVNVCYLRIVFLLSLFLLLIFSTHPPTSIPSLFGCYVSFSGVSTELQVHSICSFGVS